jgi:hypothetical protein
MENNEVMVQEQAKEIVSTPQNDLAPTSVWTDQAQFNQLARAAKMLSETNIIPQNYQGKPQDCFVAIEMATRMNISPLVVMQNMYVVKGKPSWAGQACTMLINSCGKFKDVKHIYTGKKGTDERGCYVSAVRISDGVELNGVEVTINMAKAEGWTSNQKWRNMPELMLAYRASAFFARVYCPEALMGVQTYEEVIDTDPTQEKNKAIDLTEELKGE